MKPTQLPETNSGSGSGMRSPERLYPTAGDESSIRGILEYYRILCRRKGTLILITVLGGLTALLLTLPQTPIYQASTLLEIQGINDNFLDMKDVDPTSTGNYSGGVLHSNANTNPTVEIAARPSRWQVAPGRRSTDRLLKRLAGVLAQSIRLAGEPTTSQGHSAPQLGTGESASSDVVSRPGHRSLLRLTRPKLGRPLCEHFGRRVHAAKP